MPKVEEKVETLIEKPINNLGYDVYDVIYEKEGRDNYLKIFIDSDKGISLEDCEKVNDEITDMLDEADYIKEQYFLEVSSPGVERLIRKDKHLQDNLNKKIFIKTFIQIPEIKSKEIVGTLVKFDLDYITINLEKKDEINNKQKNNIDKVEQTNELNIKRKDIVLIKKYYKW